MTAFSDLQPHFSYWDNFVRQWRLGQNPHELFLPEPWWGWTLGSEPIHSVVVNLNPGRGGRLQSRCCVYCVMGECNGSSSYSSAMADGTLRSHLADTEKWHYNQRYKPLMKALGANEKELPSDSRNHLSIELLPFHDHKDHKRYLRENREDVIQHSIFFAAAASRIIEAPACAPCCENPLRNKVIIRSDFSRLREIVKEEILKEFNSFSPQNSKIKVETFRLSYPECDEVLFVCLSGAHNHLPSEATLKEILNQQTK